MKTPEELNAQARYTVGDLLDIMALLRSENGCPWDKEQTHASIRKNFIEETYEVVEAIDNKDAVLMREELGDVLLQVVFHARISEEAGEFTFDDVVSDICRKLVVRHPHIFSDVKADTAEEVLTNWDAIKAQTKNQTTLTETMRSVSKALPALMRAEKLAKKAAKGGCGRTLHELCGDMLYDAAALCRENGIDPEQALYDACERRIAEVAQKESADNGEGEDA